MHLTKFKTNGRVSVGAIEADEVIDLSSAFPSISAAVAALASGRLAGADGAPRYRLENVELAPVADETTLVIAVALNYAGHVEETRNRPPSTPITFFKPHTSLIGAGQQLVKPRVTHRLDYEGEIAVVIGSEIYDASAEASRGAIYGITAVNDVSGRDLLKIKTDQNQEFRDWVSCKALEKSSPIGPCIIPISEVRDAFEDGSLAVETFLNGTRVQHGQLRQLLVPAVDLVRFVSSRLRLRPGDIICTGTPDGIGNVTGRLLQDGDEISIKVTGVPMLTNKVHFAPADGARSAA